MALPISSGIFRGGGASTAGVVPGSVSHGNLLAADLHVKTLPDTEQAGLSAKPRAADTEPATMTTVGRVPWLLSKFGRAIRTIPRLPGEAHAW